MYSISDIINSVQIPKLIKDPFIKEGQFELLPTGEPKRYSGGFTVVFPVIVNNEKWAFRCWYAELGNMRSRMELLSAALKENPLPYFCDFVYVDEGLVVDGKISPTTRMKWVEGLNIKDYVCKHAAEGDLLKLLADKFLTMCRDLHKLGYAHGDLQHGNIIVDTKGNLRLIDYDSMFVPSMHDYRDIIVGLKDYQHPKRKNNKLAFDRLDYFSELVIYISILAIAENPMLATKYDVEKAERMLFSATDYENIKKSPIYSDINALQGNFPLLLHILEEYLAVDDIIQLEPFDVLLDRYTKEPNIKLFEAIDGLCVYKGNTITLQWEIENYTSVYVNDKLIQSEEQGSYKETLKSDKAFCLKVVNGLHVVSSDIMIQVVEKPTIQFNSTIQKLRQGKHEHALLRWNIDNAVSAQLIVGEKRKIVDLNGEEDVYPLETTTYILKVKGLDGENFFNRRLTLSVLPESEIEFEVDKLYVLPRIPISVSWNVHNAKSVELVGYGKVSNEGEKIIEIGKDTSLILKVKDEFGTQSKKIDIKMLPLPVIKSIMIPIPQITKKVVVQNLQPYVQAAVSIPYNSMILTDNFQKMELPAIENLHVEMHGLSQFAKLPIFHPLQIKIGNKTWWRKATEYFDNLNRKCKKHIYEILWRTRESKN